MSNKWQSREWAARVVRVALFVAPAIAAWLAVSGTSQFFIEASGLARIPLWILQAILVSIVASTLTGLVAKRLLPLPSLLSLTLLFPDEAPSRFSVALRAGSTKRLREDALTLPADEGEAARQALMLATAMNKHERLTRGHMERVRAHAEVIGKEMGLSERDLNGLRWGTLLHDVGKLRVPAEILQKKGKPTDEEWKILRQHPGHSAEILQPLAEFLGPWIGAAADHHERWDGTGYPSGKQGTEISLAGRICAVADAYDVITSKRSYKDPQGADFAREELVRHSGAQFDPGVVRAFLQAGVRNEGRAGRFGWIFELPQLLQWTSVATVPKAIVAGVAAATTITSATVLPSPELSPEPLAFEEVIDDQALPSTTTIAQLGVTTTLTPTGPEAIPNDTATPTADPNGIVSAPSTTPDPAGPTTTSSSTTPTTTDPPRPTPTTDRPISTSTVPTPAPSSTTATTDRPKQGPFTGPTVFTTTSTSTTTTTSTSTTTTSTSTTTTTAAPTLNDPHISEPQVRIVRIDDVTSLADGALESSQISLIPETGPVVVQEEIAVMIYGSRGPGNDFTMGTIPEGQVVCTYIFHHDPLGGDTRTSIDFRIDFGGTIYGMTIPGAGLQASPFDHEHVFYGGRNGFEETDSIAVAGSHFSGSTTGRIGVDRVRIITACG